MRNEEVAVKASIPDWSDVQAARQFLQGHFAPTRLVAAPSLNRNGGVPTYVKLEPELPTGSFKVRGALYALHCELARTPVGEVVASSTGNHGAAVAYAARLLGKRAKIFLPIGANPSKRSRIRALGGEIVEHGTDLPAAAGAALEYARRANAFFLNDADNRDVPAGAATIAVEILEQLAEATAIWVPMGDTALIRGVAAAAKHTRPQIRIVGVQAEQAPSYYLSWKNRGVVTTTTCDTIADGLATRTPLPDNVAAIRELVDEVRLVTEAQMLTAIAHLLTQERVIAEPAGAATTAAWLADAESGANGPIVMLVTGNNISDTVLRAAVCGRDADRRHC